MRFVHKLKINLISLDTLDSTSFTIKIENGVMKAFKGSLVTFRVVRGNVLYLLQGSTIEIKGNANVVPSLDNTILQYKRMGRVSEKFLIELVKQGVLGSERLGNLKFCVHHIFGKHTRIMFSKGQYTITHALDYVHSNLWGSPLIQFLGGCKYIFLSLVDDYTRRVWTFTVKNKE